LVSYSALQTNDGRLYANNRSADPKELVLSGNLVWSPVSGLDIGVEVVYARTEFGARVADAKNALRTIKSDDAFTGRLRIQRDF
jgi:hypothetical protein